MEGAEKEEEEEEEEEEGSATTAPSASRGQGKFSAARLDNLFHILLQQNIRHEVTNAPFFQSCDNMVCGDCVGQLSHCPLCRQDFGERPAARNRFAERLLLNNA